MKTAEIFFSGQATFKSFIKNPATMRNLALLCLAIVVAGLWYHWVGGGGIVVREMCLFLQEQRAGSFLQHFTSTANTQKRISEITYSLPDTTTLFGNVFQNQE